jgi:hypothetical protein
VDPERSRTPSFKFFLVTGAVLGFVVGAVVAITGPDASNYSSGTAIGYLGVLGAVIGLALGGGIALLVDFLRHRSGPQA